MTSHRTMTGDQPEVGVGEGYRRLFTESACIFRAVRPIAQRFVEAIERCGSVLAAHFPATPDERSELPDRISLI